ncbi:unnamed protein product [Linum trigynum]|uniref:Uncharacterized protein n=1 Tax=Linum trigynum TaxID=586398 RepID=A0AAV2CH42_9ROSI
MECAKDGGESAAPIPLKAVVVRFFQSSQVAILKKEDQGIPVSVGSSQSRFARSHSSWLEEKNSNCRWFGTRRLQRYSAGGQSLKM